jgi:ABC-2 type transport system ATP-binding protein
MDVVEKVSDRIVLIDDGSIIANGTFEELKSQQGDKSLEQIFAALTSNASLDTSADELARALEG